MNDFSANPKFLAIKKRLNQAISNQKIHIEGENLDQLTLIIIKKEEISSDLLDKMGLKKSENKAINSIIKELIELECLNSFESETGLKCSQKIDEIFREFQITKELKKQLMDFVLGLNEVRQEGVDQLKIILEELEIKRSQENMIIQQILELLVSISQKGKEKEAKQTAILTEIHSLFQELNISIDDQTTTVLTEYVIHITPEAQQSVEDVFERLDLRQSQIKQILKCLMSLRQTYFGESLNSSQQQQQQQQQQIDILPYNRDNTQQQQELQLFKSQEQYQQQQYFYQTPLITTITSTKNVELLNPEIDRSEQCEDLKLIFKTQQILASQAKSQQNDPKLQNLLIDNEIMIQLVNELKQKDKSEAFIIDEYQLNEKFARITMLESPSLEIIIEQSKQYIFDLLKRKTRINLFLRAIKELADEKESLSFSKISELEFIILLILSVNEEHHGQLGNWLINDSYPLPIFFKAGPNNFNFMDRLLLHNYESVNPLIVHIGTPSTIGTGKTKILLALLGEDKDNLEFYFDQNGEKGLLNNDSILYYSHLFKGIQLADVNYSGVNSLSQLSNAFRRGLQTVLNFSSFKIIQVNIDHDFDQNGVPGSDLKTLLFEWCIQQSVFPDYNKFFIIYHDFSPNQKQKKEMVQNELKKLLGEKLIGDLSIINLQKMHGDSFKSQIARCCSELLGKIEAHIKSFTKGHEIGQILNFYNDDSKIIEDDPSKQSKRKDATDKKYNQKVIQQNQLIIEELNRTPNFQDIFPFQHYDMQIQEKQIELDKLEIHTTTFYSEFTDKSISERKEQLRASIKNLTNQKNNLSISKPLKMIFLHLLSSSSNNVSFLVSEIESCLQQWKLPILKPIKSQYGDFLQQLQMICQTSSTQKIEEINSQIKQLDYKIDNYDISFETIIQEIISFHQTGIKHQQQQPFTQTKEIQLVQNKILDDLLNSRPVNVVDGKTLQFGNSILDEAIKTLDPTKKVFVLSIIGAQSSAKSTLLNFLFGCGFQTSQGRCTKGMYLTILSYENYYIILIDTQGLLSIQARDHKFDNQVCTMAFALSKLVLVNNKGEINQILKNLLEVCLYSLQIIIESRSKPKLVFCLRDQSANDLLTQKQMLTNLMSSLNEAATNAGTNVSDLVDISQDDLFLLASAYQTTKGMNQKEVFYPSTLFPNQVLKLRHYLIQVFIKSGQVIPYENIQSFYQYGKETWKLIQERGDNLLQMKSILEHQVKMLLDEAQQKYQDSNIPLLSQELITIFNKTEHLKDFSQISQQLEGVKAKFFLQAETEFKDITNEQRYGNNKKWKQLALKSIHSGFSYIFGQALYNFKQKHAKKSSTSKLQEIDKDLMQQINGLISKGKTTEADFDQEFEQFIKIELKKVNDEQKNLQKQDTDYILQRFFAEYTTQKKKEVEKKSGQFQDINLDTLSHFIRFEAQGFIQQFRTRGILTEKQIKDWIDISWWRYSKEKTYQKVFEILFDFTKQILKICESQSDKLNIQASQIISTIQNTEQQWIKDQINLKRPAFPHFLSHYALSILFEEESKRVERQKTEFQNELERLIEEKRRFCKECFDFGITSSLLGAKLAQTMYLNINQLFTDQQIDQWNSLVHNEISTSEKLNTDAYKISFRNRHLPNVVAYIEDFPSLILKISSRICEKQEENISHQRKRISNELTVVHDTVLDTVKQWEKSIQDNPLNTKKFSELFSQNKKICMYIKDYREYDSFANSQLFVEEFLNTYQNVLKQITEISEQIIKQIITSSVEFVEKQTLQKIGCIAKCPYCATKCCLDQGHDGDHKVIEHLVLGFAGWRNLESRVVILRKCSDANMHNFTYQGINAQLQFDEHIKENNPSWRDSIPEKEKAHDQNNQEQDDIIIAWEGTKNYFLKKHDILDGSPPNWVRVFNESNIKPFDS